jgi:hypothetical protein
LATKSYGSAGTWVKFKVTSAVTGNGTFSFAISGGSADAIDYASRQSTKAPVLKIVP